MAVNGMQFIGINTQVVGTTVADIHAKAKAEVARLTEGYDETKIQWNYSGVSGRDANGLTGTPGAVVDYVALIQVSVTIDA